MTADEQFLVDMRDAAKGAGHIWPQFAACEVAVESGWGKSTLAREAFNLFGQKAPAKLANGQMTISLPTQEYQGGMMVRVTADWLRFPTAQACLEARMALLRRLPLYAYALRAKTGEEYVREVSARWLALDAKPSAEMQNVFEFASGWFQWQQGRWSTDPARAKKVLETYAAHAAILSPPPDGGPSGVPPDVPRGTSIAPAPHTPNVVEDAA